MTDGLPAHSLNKPESPLKTELIILKTVILVKNQNHPVKKKDTTTKADNGLKVTTRSIDSTTKEFVSKEPYSSLCQQLFLFALAENAEDEGVKELNKELFNFRTNKQFLKLYWDLNLLFNYKPNNNNLRIFNITNNNNSDFNLLTDNT